MNKTVIVTGVTRGIGRQIAFDLAQSGYLVIGFYKNNESLANELSSKSGMIKTYKCDVANYDSVCKIADEILKQYGDVYAVVNNAGVAKTSLFTDVSEEEFDNIFDVNVKGTFAVTKAFLPSMIKRKCGKIVNVSSIWGVSGGSCEVVYSASKAAVIGMTKALSREVGPSGINVNCIAPGVIETDMLNNLSNEDKENLAQETSLLRNGTPKDVSNVVKFLLGPDSDFITGQVITVDGGMI